MEKAGLERISQFRIIKLSEKDYVTSICFSEKSNFGFLYESSHSAIPKVTDRDVVSMYKTMTGNDYSEKVVSLNGESDFIKIKDVPDGLYIIKENPYWYQYTNNKGDDALLVTKEIIIEILRSDVRAILANKIK